MKLLTSCAMRNYENTGRFSYSFLKCYIWLSNLWFVTWAHCVCTQKRSTCRMPERMRVRIPKYKMWSSKKIKTFKPGRREALESKRFEGKYQRCFVNIISFFPTKNDQFFFWLEKITKVFSFGTWTLLSRRIELRHYFGKKNVKNHKVFL